MKQQTYHLKNTWSRLIHRFHLLGATQLTYRNESVGIIENRTYPIHVANLQEKVSNSLLGEHMWQVNHWAQGWGLVNENAQTASLHFRSNKGDLFHSIRLNKFSEWECFECLLKLFTDTSEEAKNKINNHHQTLEKKQKTHSLQLADVLEKSIVQKQSIKFTLFTSGGIVSRKYSFKELVSNDHLIKMSAPNTQMLIDMNTVDHVIVNRSKKTTQGTIYSAAGMPKLIFEAA